MGKCEENSNEQVNQQPRGKKIAIIVQANKLTPDESGLDRTEYIADMLGRAGYDVDLITSRFQHWSKSQRPDDFTKGDGRAYNLILLDEPGYERNIDLKRVWSHHVLGKNLKTHLAAHGKEYDLIWSHIPPNNIASIAAQFAHDNNIPFIVDVNDLWPEAMKMVVNIPIISDIAFYPLTYQAKKTYRLADGAVGTSREYACHPNTFRNTEIDKTVVYVGNNLAKFDAGVDAYSDGISKKDGEFWVMYAGTLGKSYDIPTLIRAGRKLLEEYNEGKLTRCPKIMILGDGPDHDKFSAEALNLDALNVKFVGRVDYQKMAAYLSKCDVTVNSLVKGAPQSIVSKIGDYLAAGKPMINTGESVEFKTKCECDNFGINVEPGNVDELAEAIKTLMNDGSSMYTEMGENARRIAETEFDREEAYKEILRFVEDIMSKKSL